MSDISIMRFNDIKVALLSLGCKVNSYETDAIRKQFEELGALIVDFDDACKGRNDVHADVFVVNTCSVTNIADRKSRQMLHRARQNNPDAVVAATGCYAQIGADELILNGDADIVVGNSHKTELIDSVYKLLESKGMTQGDAEGKEFVDCLVTSMKDERSYEDMIIESCEERTRAFVKIEDGCNQFCSYCIIPYARGRVRSRSTESIINEIKGLADRGFREVVLTGIHVSSFGIDNYEKNEGFDYRPLYNLIHEVALIDGIERIRLGSLEPRIITEEFAQKLASEPKFCPYFHLSLQSGSDSVLKRMNRHYTAEEFFGVTQILRKFFDRPSLNTDVIVGFPGETEGEFEECRIFLEKVNFAKMHIFKYSRRKGTVADKMPGQLTDAVKHSRSEKLSETDNANHSSYMEQFIGENEQILVEALATIEGKDYFVGLTTRYVQVAVPKEAFGSDMVNAILDVRIRGFLNCNYLLGEV